MNNACMCKSCIYQSTREDKACLSPYCAVTLVCMKKCDDCEGMTECNDYVAKGVS